MRSRQIALARDLARDLARALRFPASKRVAT
jgi:hypothetical protein